eukprot:6485681-Amphidinium_carterae.2
MESWNKSQNPVNGSVSFEFNEFNFELIFDVVHVLLHVSDCAIHSISDSNVRITVFSSAVREMSTMAGVQSNSSNNNTTAADRPPEVILIQSPTEVIYSPITTPEVIQSSTESESSSENNSVADLSPAESLKVLRKKRQQRRRGNSGAKIQARRSWDSSARTGPGFCMTTACFIRSQGCQLAPPQRGRHPHSDASAASTASRTTTTNVVERKSAVNACWWGLRSARSSWLNMRLKQSCNGYSSSLSVQNIPLEEAQISNFAAAVHMSESLVEALKSEDALCLTRSSVNHTECFLQCGPMGELNLVTSEVLQALAMDVPHSSKIRATLKAQSPELHERLMTMVNQIKSAWLKEEKSKSTSSSSASNSVTPVTIQLAEGDEIIHAVHFHAARPQTAPANQLATGVRVRSFLLFFSIFTLIDSRTGVNILLHCVHQTSVMLELVIVHDVPVTPVPVTLVTIIVHSCHIGSRFQVKCCEQSANKTRLTQ